MRADELHRLHEHARGAAAGVVHPAAVGLEHLDQELDHAARRVELAALLALGARELREEVLGDAAEHVLGAARLVADLDVADEVDELPEARLVEGGAGVVLGQHALERRVVALDAGHDVVHELADGGLAGLRLEVRPARLGRDPEDALGAVLVGIFEKPGDGVAAVAGRGREVVLGLRIVDDAPEVRVALLEGVGDVLQEEQAEATCLYSAASMLPRSASAICQSWAS